MKEKLLVGTDVEFGLYNTKRKNSTDSWLVSTNEVGIDGWQGEIRPKPEKNGLKLARNIYKLMKDALLKLNQTVDDKEKRENLIIIGGNNAKGVRNNNSYTNPDIRNFPLGGHIHVSYKNETTCINSVPFSMYDAYILDAMLLIITLMNSSYQGLCDRQIYKYGCKLQVYTKSVNNGWYELRSMASQLNMLEMLPIFYEFSALFTRALYKHHMHKKPFFIPRLCKNIKKPVLHDYGNILNFQDDFTIADLNLDTQRIKEQSEWKTLQKELHTYFNKWIYMNEKIPHLKKLIKYAKLIMQYTMLPVGFDDIPFNSRKEQLDKLNELLKVTKTRKGYNQYINEYLNSI